MSFFKKNLFAVMAGLLSIVMASNVMATSSVPSKSGYFPILLQNNIGTGSSTYPVNNVYVLFTGTQIAKPNPACVMQLTPTQVSGYNAWIASCQTLTLSTQASAYSYTMTKLASHNPSDPVLVYIPNVISGRAFVSLNYSLDLPITKAASGNVTFQLPSLTNTTDGNYNLIYDKFEYTYDATDTFWIDTTSVDDFSLPIALSYNGTNNGYTGQSRSTVINGVQGVLQSKGDPDWQNLVITDQVSGTGSIMRIDAPNTSPVFNAHYFTSPSGFNYKQALIQYYGPSNSNTLKIDCSEVDSSKYPEYVQLGSGTDPQAYHFTGSVNSAGHFIFNNDTTIAAHQMAVDVDLTDAHSIDFFGPGQSPFDTPNGTVRSVIIKNFTAAASVGLIPAPSGTYLKSSFYTNALTNNLYYKQNSILNGSPYNAYASVKGPWYNLYAHAIHSVSANHVYAFAYDDVLKQDGTISVANASPGPTEQPVVITFGSVGNLQVPAAGPNYNANPPANDVYPVGNVQQTAFNCSSGSCTVSATWTPPKQGQDTAVQYYMIPQPSPEVPKLLQAELPFMVPYSATGMTITYPEKNPPSMLTQVMVYACIPSNRLVSSGYDCPSVANKYKPGTGVVGAGSPPKGVVLYPVTPLTNSGFSCSGNNCTLNATWTVPANEPTGTQFYILPQKNTKASIIDILDGQNPMPTGGSGTLTLPAADVNTVNAPIIIMACINQGNRYCPSASNNYNQSQGVGSTILNPTS